VDVTAAERTAAAATTGLTGPAETPVSAAMTGDIVTVRADASAREAARTMAEAGVHCVAVPGEPWRLLSDLDLLAGAPPRPAVTVPADATLVQAGRLMGRHAVSHLLVADAAGHPVGVISALDVARHIAFGTPAR
jgi:CBS domain-containing protein